MTQAAEAAKFDFVFVADSMGVRDWPVEVLSRVAQTTWLYDPLTLMSSLSAVTSNIGFVVTTSTSFTQPYIVARQFASFHHMSGGRAAWNIIAGTQNNEGANFGMTMFGHEERYARAAEFAQIVKGLRHTTQPGVVVADKATGRLFDPAKVEAFHHEGKFFKVDGILNVPASPYGDPLLVQAGASPPGRDLASSVAEIIFAATPLKSMAQEYYGDMKSRMKEKGRSPEDAVVMPGFIPIIGNSREEAIEQLAELDDLIHPNVAITVLSDLMDFDLSPYPLDGPVPDVAETRKSRTALVSISKMAGQENMTLREIANWMCGTMGHVRVAGTPEQIADTMQEWVEDGACDGFLVSPLLHPSGFDRFIAEVVPILRRRGLFRREYEGSTLRENLGVKPV